MAPETPTPERPQTHQGHDLETGILGRVREWIDVFAWLRLVRTLRLAGSPPMILMGVVTLLIWWLGQHWILGEQLELVAIDGKSASAVSASQDSLMTTMRFVRLMNATTVLSPTINDIRILRQFGSILWTVLIWSPAAIVFVRQGALLTAGRSMMSLRDVWRIALRRSPAAWVTAIVPLACVLVMGLAIYLITLVTQMAPESPWLLAPAAVAIVLISIPCGILAFGANVAVPLAWSALANERDPDALDSLSRGYEYLYRRPLHLILNALVAFILLLVVTFLITGIVSAAGMIALAILQWAGAPDGLERLIGRMLAIIPMATCFAFSWALVGGIYLLVRAEAGGQQVEDLWEPKRPPSRRLPKLPS
ncbi:hypothetical protein CA13_42530 [Planctomycetes bacterium CA13]|uniref:Glycerophosphoryl diester phosphodiesterase membrane domain-containing protein n=1 Tax=Novipirellula herctigrandis TaxID=2527986 RepID=A0A5C5Z6I6_9BACT|nr:hypothetical protein CA13_42530 [Planctomycetes bacterium CA13]